MLLSRKVIRTRRMATFTQTGETADCVPLKANGSRENAFTFDSPPSYGDCVRHTQLSSAERLSACSSVRRVLTIKFKKQRNQRCLLARFDFKCLSFGWICLCFEGARNREWQRKCVFASESDGLRHFGGSQRATGGSRDSFPG